MKTLGKYLFVAVASLALASCSSDEPDAVIPGPGLLDNKAVITANPNDFDEAATFVCSSNTVYISDSQNDWTWEERGPVLGGDPAITGDIVISRGKVFIPPYFGSFCLGGNPISYVWYSYVKDTGTDTKLFVNCPYTYTSDKFLLNIYTRDFVVKSFTDTDLVFLCESTYDGGRTHQGGKELEVICYKRDKPIVFDGVEAVAFESDPECYRYILRLAREHFGNEIDQNKIYAGSAILENPIIKLDEVEKWIDTLDKPRL